MYKKLPFLVTVFFISVFISCSKKTVPTAAKPTIETDSVVLASAAPDSVATVKKTVVTRRAKPATPKVIVVNDKSAKKSVDGRLYYDLQGHRYWRNYQDGKYYLYNKSMNSDAAFKPPHQ